MKAWPHGHLSQFQPTSGQSEGVNGMIMMMSSASSPREGGEQGIDLLYLVATHARTHATVPRHPPQASRCPFGSVILTLSIKGHVVREGSFELPSHLVVETSHPAFLHVFVYIPTSFDPPSSTPCDVMCFPLLCAPSRNRREKTPVGLFMCPAKDKGGFARPVGVRRPACRRAFSQHPPPQSRELGDWASYCHCRCGGTGTGGKQSLARGRRLCT